MSCPPRSPHQARGSGRSKLGGGREGQSLTASDRIKRFKHSSMRNAADGERQHSSLKLHFTTFHQARKRHVIHATEASANMAFYIERAAGNIPVRRTDPYNIVGIRIVLSHSVYPFRYSLAFSTIGLSVSRNGFIRAYSTLVSREQNV